MSKSRPKSEEEVLQYIQELSLLVEAGEFYDHMEMVGWVYGKNKMPVKDWKACVRTWHRFAKKRAPTTNEVRL